MRVESLGSFRIVGLYGKLMDTGIGLYITLPRYYIV
jgi:hypothetical protein